MTQCCMDGCTGKVVKKTGRYCEQHRKERQQAGQKKTTLLIILRSVSKHE